LHRACECWQKRKVRERREAKQEVERGRRGDRKGPKKAKEVETMESVSQGARINSGYSETGKNHPAFRNKGIGSSVQANTRKLGVTCFTMRSLAIVDRDHM
jgi:hypothetical protein